MTDADHEAILAQIRNQLTTPLPIGTDHPPRQENPAMRDLLEEVEDAREVIRLVKGQRDRAEAALARVTKWAERTTVTMVIDGVPQHSGYAEAKRDALATIRAVAADEQEADHA